LRGWIFAAWIRRTKTHPLFEHFEIARREFFARRHLEIRIPVADCFDEKTGLGVAGDEGRPGIAPCLPPRLKIKPQPPFDFLGSTVAFETVLLQKRTDLLLKKLVSFVRRRGVVRWQSHRSLQHPTSREGRGNTEEPGV
jgi:hypothetical protein